MYEKKHSLTFLLFILLCIAVMLISFMGNWDGGVFNNQKLKDELVESTNDSNFLEARIYISKDGIPFMFLDAHELMFSGSLQKSFANGPKGLIFTKAQEEVRYRGDKGLFDEKLQKFTLEENVFMETGDTKASARKMNYFPERDYIELFDNVKTSSFYQKQLDYIEAEGDYAEVFPAIEKVIFKENVKGFIRREKRYEESLYFTSRFLTLDLIKGKVYLRENVHVKKQQLTAKSRRGEIFLDNYNKKLKYFVLYDDVKVVEKVLLEKTLTLRRAFSEKLEGMMRESKMILTGYPKVYQQNDIIKGNKIILRENTEVIEVIDANTNILIED